MSSTVTLETLQVVMEANTKKFNEEIKKVQNQVKTMTDSVNKQVSKVKSAISSITKSVVGLFALSKVSKYIQNSLQSAMQVEASLQQVARTMGESTQSFLKWAKTNALSFNMAQSDALKFGATYSNLVSSFLSDTNQITGATTELLKASSVIASATGRTMDDVMERIRSGLLGNTEAIEDLGVNVNVALLETTEAFKRLANGKSWNQLSFQTQQQIRLMAILEQTASKFGNEVFQNTNSSLQQLVAILKDVALNLGNAFLPIANVVIPLLSKMAMWLRKVTSYFATFMQTLFGYSPKANAGIGGTVNSTIGQVGNLGDSLDSAGTSADKTKKKLQNLLGGFDELNTISFDTSSDSGSSGTGGVGAGASGLDLGNIGSFEFEEPDTSKIEAWVTKFKDLFKPLTESWEKVKKALQPIIETVGSVLKWLYDNVLVPFTTWSISDLLPAFFDLLAGALNILSPILEVFVDLGKWLWVEFLQPIASWTGGIIVSVLEGLADVLSDIGNWMSEHKGIIETFTIIVGSFALAWGLVSAALAITTFISGIWAGVCYIASVATTAFGLAILALTSPITLTIIAIGAIIAIAILLWKNWDEVSAWLIEIWETIKTKALEIWTRIKEFLSETWEKIKTTCSEVWTKVKEFFISSWSNIKEVANNVWNGILNTCKTIFDNLKNYMSDIWDGIKQIFTGVIDFVIGVFTGDWERAWEGVKSVFKGIFDTFGTIVKAPLNAVIKMINACINGLNKIKFSIPNWVPGIGGNSYGINIPNIPMLAKGGILDSPTLAMVAEAGKEAVVPLENNTKGLDLLATKLFEKMPTNSSNSSNDSPVEIILQVGDTKLGRVVIDSINKLQRQSGRMLLDVDL